MRKEIIWAAAIGIGFGLTVAFGIWRINSSLKPTITNPKASPTPASTNSELKVVLDKPENNDVVTNNSVTVSGITKAKTWVTISSEQDDYILGSDATGAFSQDVKLIPGVNQIKLTAIDPSGNQNIEKVIVVYSVAFKPNTIASPSPQDISSQSAIRQKVAEKVSQALNRPKAYMGVVTDIADSTIQIKSVDSQIKQISVSAGGNIAVINTAGTNNNEVKLTDIAIGDFIIAMGYVNTNSVLTAQRIIISDPVTDNKISSTFAKVTNSNVRPILVSNIKDGQTTKLTPTYLTDMEIFKDGKEKVINSSGINDGDQIIYVLDEGGKTPKVRAIFVVIQAPQN